MVALYHKPSDHVTKATAKDPLNEQTRGEQPRFSSEDFIPKNAINSRLSNEAWDKEAYDQQHKPWNATVTGRGAIRLFSRGIMGASGFALGAYYAKRTMATYNPNMELAWNSHISHRIAKTVDQYISRPLEHLVTHMGYDGKAFVTFRPTKRYYESIPHLASNGSTLGHEVVSMTLDFAAASIFDGMGRDIASALDPNVNHNWKDEKGNINYWQVLKNVTYSGWKYLTYNQGEDWAVALPYVFFCRAQRNFIDWLSPGFGYDSDRRMNGSSFKVDDQGKVNGTYNLEGAFDLQTRFTAYNVGTLMFRETYSETAHYLQQWYKNGFKIPSLSDSEWISNPVKAIGNTLRWAARDTIKGVMYMTPAVPAFWIFRTPQTKYRAAFINKDKGIMCYRRGLGDYDVNVIHANELTRSTNRFLNNSPYQFRGDTETFFSKFEHNDWTIGHAVPNPIAPYSAPLNPNGNNKYPAFSRTYGISDTILNPFGYVSNLFRKTAHHGLHFMEHATGWNLDSPRFHGKNLLDVFINAQWAYTPYFLVKNDIMAHKIDRAPTDMGTERTIDGITHLDGKEVMAGLCEIKNAVLHKPFDDPEREAEAQRRLVTDRSAADGQENAHKFAALHNAIGNMVDQVKGESKLDKEQFVERIKDSKKRSENLLKGFRDEEIKKFSDKVSPRADLQEGYAARERWRQSHTSEDYPEINTILH